MDPTLGLVTDTISFSNVDGPGNRFVVFLQGCNFDCVACHNPYTINVCNDCGECVRTCPSGALRLGELARVLWDEARCTGGDTCLTVCPSNASPKARWQRVNDILTRVRRAAPFLSGITVSGGEATQQWPFVRALFEAVRADPALAQLTCFVDSNGAAPIDVWEALAPVTDGAMIDLKCLDPVIHRAMTGQPTDEVLASIRWLAARGLLYEVRLLLAEGRNDADDLLHATARWLVDVDPAMRIKLIAFRPHGTRPVEPPLRTPSPARMDEIAAIFHAVSDSFDVCVI